MQPKKLVKMELIEILKTLKQFLDPEYLIQLGGVVAVVLIVFAETGLMIGFFLPGDSLLFTAGLFTATGLLDINILLFWLLLVGAAIIGDQVGYLFGRKTGEALFQKKDSLLFKKKYIEKTKEFYDKYGGNTIIIGRFVPIVRTFAPILAGVVKFPYKTFVVYNIIGGLLWITSMLFAGYTLGTIFPSIKKYIELIAIVIIIISVIPIIRTYLKERKLKNAQQNS